MMRPLSPIRAAAGGIDRNTTLTLNDGTVWRPLMPSGRMVLVGESKPVRPCGEILNPKELNPKENQAPPAPVLRSAADPPRPVQRPLF
jgi:hypothetical protein